jgi:hypothetical protein
VGSLVLGILSLPCVGIDLAQLTPRMLLSPLMYFPFMTGLPGLGLGLAALWNIWRGKARSGIAQALGGMALSVFCMVIALLVLAVVWEKALERQRHQSVGPRPVEVQSSFPSGKNSVGC